AHVEVDDDGLVAAQGEAGADGGAGGGFTHAALAGSDYEDLGQGDSPQIYEKRAFPGREYWLPDALQDPENWPQYPLKAGDVQHVTRQADLHRLAPQGIAAQLLGGLVLAGHGEHLGAHLLAEDARPGIALDPGQGAAAQRAVHMDVAVG